MRTCCALFTPASADIATGQKSLNRSVRSSRFRQYQTRSHQRQISQRRHRTIKLDYRIRMPRTVGLSPMAIPTGIPINPPRVAPAKCASGWLPDAATAGVHKSLRPGNGEQFCKYLLRGGKNSGLISCSAATAHHTVAKPLTYQCLRSPDARAASAIQPMRMQFFINEHTHENASRSQIRGLKHIRAWR